MLRLYTPIQHDIFTLHTLLEKVVCDVWCTACNISCDSKLEQAFKEIYKYTYNGSPLKEEIERIYVIFKDLDPPEVKTKIRDAFIINNNIEALCNGTKPVYLEELPDVVENDIKPLFNWCYEKLLAKGKVAGDKMDYYNKLIKHPANDFDTCPCCGLIDIESAESICREDYDHYLPKAHYPFSSVNFLNLVPICKKCNQDRKKSKDPIKDDRVAFYPFSTELHDIEIKLEYMADINKDDKKLNFDELEINLDGETDKIDTWNWLFHIETRYNDYITSKANSWLRGLETRYQRNKRRNQGLSYVEIINDHIEDYEDDKYSEKKFLKIAFLKAIKSDASFMAVYE